MTLARYRPTAAQAAALGAYRGLLVGAPVALALAVSAAGVQRGGWSVAAALVVPSVVAAVVGAAVGLSRGRDAGVDVDDLGLHRVPQHGPGALPPLHPWHGIADIRPERRGGRTVVAVYLDNGISTRLAAPYDGRLFARDPRFEWKLFTLRNLWETHRSWNRRSGH